MSQPSQFLEVPRTAVNYLFFGVYFLITALIHVFHVILVDPHISLSTYFFVVYAIAECTLETILLIFIAGFLNRFMPRMVNLFALGAFFLFLGHAIDFFLVRLVDMSFWYALHFVSQESYENFIQLLLASNVSLFIWALAGFAGAALLLAGILIFRLTNRWSLRRPISVPLPIGAATLCSFCLFLLFWDYGLRGHVPKVHLDRYQKTLPWKSTLLQHKAEYLPLKTRLHDLETEEELMCKLDSRVFSLTHKPDIYLFVVESLRDDYINAANTPVIHRFKEENISFDLALSNANATHLSWFSLFYSKFPLYWGKVEPEEWKQGSFPLALLKKMGYKIYVSSSARLSYYQMDRIIFGEDQHLADSFFIPEDEEVDEPYLRDQKAIDNLLVEMDKGSSGRVFITFLDATHFDYSWPKELTQFYPIEDKINYFKAAVYQGGLESIKNRYRNALHFVDTLFAKFLKSLHKSPGGNEAIVMLTGDHGEEFFEHGNLFHISNLSHPQMHIPLYYRLGDHPELRERARCSLSCHMDVFPTIFHYLVGEDLMSEVLQGESIFKEDRWPYVVVARFNANRSPTEFCIHNGSHKLIAEFNNERDIFSSSALKVLSTKNCRDENLSQDISVIHQAFDSALEHIFSQKVISSR